MTLFITLFALFALALLNAPSIVRHALRLYVYLLVQANSRAKCPCCGVREKHKMQFGVGLRKLVHFCARCGANWAEEPMVSADRWAMTLPQDLEDGIVDKDGVRTTTVQHAQRNPVISYQPAGSNKPIIYKPSAGGQA